MLLQPITTPLGILFGRDCIYVDVFTQKHQQMLIEGEISGNLLRPKISSTWIPFTMTFERAMAAIITEREHSEWQSKSSFDLVVESEWCRNLSGTGDTGVQHFVLSGYDHIYQVAAKSFHLVIGDGHA